jgi:hypothetical protein
MMNGPEKSDPAIVAGKPTNKAERSAAELVEPRAGTKGNADQLSTRRTQRRISVTQGVGSHTAAYAVNTRGGSRMRESRLYGSVRGARGNSRPYREGCNLLRCMSPQVALTDDYAMSDLTEAIWGKPDQICSVRDFLRMTHRRHAPRRTSAAQK